MSFGGSVKEDEEDVDEIEKKVQLIIYGVDKSLVIDFSEDVTTINEEVEYDHQTDHQTRKYQERGMDIMC